eukprot:CAMPEP_0179078206 /NCGR_PEP_ID=MMETSP0796-20121207/35006_1 /TAXON_ID=73915 /ORGANISM="Pyrodinium bahamense, Strain pbaha01" /LENGTH=156 /DNA_ID=CAMNT_0020775501 /DNA_START=285 /DNA_END=752 /DNA_ORIENTATION=+
MVYNVEGMPRNVLAAHHGIGLHPLRADVTRGLLRADGPPACLLPVEVPRATRLCHLVAHDLPVFALHVVCFLASWAGGHPLDFADVRGAALLHIDWAAHVLIAEVAARALPEPLLLEDILCLQGVPGRTRSRLHGGAPSPWAGGSLALVSSDSAGA